MSTLYDGDSTDLTLSKTVSVSSIGYGHIDSKNDVDYGTLSISSSGYYDVLPGGHYDTLSVYDVTTGKTVSHLGSSTTGLYLEKNDSYQVVVTSSYVGKNYTVQLRANTTIKDGDTNDLNTSKVVSLNNQVSGHTDFKGDVDTGTLSFGSGYIDLYSTGNTTVSVYDATVGKQIYSSSGSATTGLYIDSSHSNQIMVSGNTPGEYYKVAVGANTTIYDGDANDLTLSKTVSLGSAGYGHSDKKSDVDSGSLSLNSSGYYDLTSTGNTTIAVYDATIKKQIYSSSGSSLSGIYLDKSHSNQIMVTGNTAGESYSVSLKASSTTTAYKDGDTSDLTTSDVVSLSSIGYGHTDLVGDVDTGTISIGYSDYYDLTSSGNTKVSVFDVKAGKNVSSSSGSASKGLYLAAGGNYQVNVTGSTSGEAYSVSLAQGTAPATSVSSSIYIDGDSTDLTISKIIKPTGGYQTASGHTDYIGDLDKGTVSVSKTGYYNVTCTGSTQASIYDDTTGLDVYSSSGSYTTGLYLYADHENFVYVTGGSVGEVYNVTVKPM